jgi:hypothetical protein
MAKKGKPTLGVLQSAHFELSKSETAILETLLSETNRTKNNFVETILKLVLARYAKNSMLIDMSELGIRYRIEKQIRLAKQKTAKP